MMLEFREYFFLKLIPRMGQKWNKQGTIYVVFSPPLWQFSITAPACHRHAELCRLILMFAKEA